MIWTANILVFIGCMLIAAKKGFGFILCILGDLLGAVAFWFLIGGEGGLETFCFYAAFFIVNVYGWWNWGRTPPELGNNYRMIGHFHVYDPRTWWQKMLCFSIPKFKIDGSIVGYNPYAAWPENKYDSKIAEDRMHRAVEQMNKPKGKIYVDAETEGAGIVVAHEAFAENPITEESQQLVGGLTRRTFDGIEFKVQSVERKIKKGKWTYWTTWEKV